MVRQLILRHCSNYLTINRPKKLLNLSLHLKCRKSLQFVNSIRRMFQQKVEEIKNEQYYIDTLTSSIESSSSISSWGSEPDYESTPIYPKPELCDLLLTLDNELAKIQLIKDDEG